MDSWIWSVRLAKTRSAASGACRAGHVRVNGMRVKPAHSVRAGDEVRLRQDGRERVVVVVRVIARRAGAPVAAGCSVDRSPHPPSGEETVTVAARDRGTGRPAKRERRSTGKLPGRPAGRPGFICTGTPARRCGAIRRCQLTTSGTRVRRARPGYSHLRLVPENKEPGGLL